MEQVAVDIAGRLTGEAARVWPDMVRQSFVYNALCTTTLVGMLLGCIWGLAIARRLWADHKSAEVAATESGRGYYGDGSMWAGMIVAVSVLVFLMAISYLPTAVSGVLYPEAATVRELIKGK